MSQFYDLNAKYRKLLDKRTSIDIYNYITYSFDKAMIIEIIVNFQKIKKDIELSIISLPIKDNQDNNKINNLKVIIQNIENICNQLTNE